MDGTNSLERMTEYAARRFAEEKFCLHPRDGYLRVNAAGYRAVCVSPRAPLCGFSSTSEPDLGKALTRFDTLAEPSNEVAAGRDERCLQAHLIRSALTNRLDLLPALGPIGRFERLLFALDEVRLSKDGGDPGAARCDLLAVGKLENRWEPVVIELKWERQLAQLCRQLAVACHAIQADPVGYGKLLGAAVGQDVQATRAHRMLVWPGPPSRLPRTIASLEEAGAIVVAFERAGDGGYVFQPEFVPAEP